MADENNPAEVDPPAVPEANANAIAPRVQWVTNPMVGNFNPGTRSGQDIFHKKTKGLPEDKRYSVTQKEAPAIKRFLKGKETELGGIVARVPIAYNDDRTVKARINLITQHQLADLELLKRQAYARYVGPLAAGAAVPEGPSESRVLDPANSAADEALFYQQVHSMAVAELIKNTVTPAGLTKIL